jgi:predicted transposase/invertase (TIGR01784 family)
MNMYRSDVIEIQLACEKLQEYEVLNNKHDKGYKYLLSVRKMFLQLLRSFVEQGWVDKIRENDIVLVDKSFILQEFEEKEADLVYRVKLDGKEVVFYILLELQSSVDHQMPYRLLLYMLAIWKTLLKDAGKEGERKDFRLPAIVPCVLYNGKDNWTVCRSFKETLEASELFGDNVLDFKYILFDVKRYDENRLLELTNLIGTVFFIEQKPEYEALVKRLDQAMVKLSKLEQEEQALFFTWFKNIIIRGMPTEKAEGLKKAIEQSREGTDMVYAIEEAIRKEFQRQWEDGLEKGIAKGIEKGIETTARNFLSMGMTVEQVVQGTGLSYERVQELKALLPANE